MLVSACLARPRNLRGVLSVDRTQLLCGCADAGTLVCVALTKLISTGFHTRQVSVVGDCERGARGAISSTCRKHSRLGLTCGPDLTADALMGVSEHIEVVRFKIKRNR